MDYANFLRGVAKHQITVVKDDGLYRHLRFKQPDTFNMSFDIITWPSYLAYVGDMGSYVFSRVPDMLKFFRNEHPRGCPRINPGYWAEKCQASDRNDGIREYSSDCLLEAVEDYMEEWPDDIKVVVREELLEFLDLECECIARNELQGWSHEAPDGECYDFSNFWEYNTSKFTERYLWCCYALVWGIKQYDEMRASMFSPEESL